nr:MAG TPA: hypothetical protein [Caudoviricetes sp.]DAN76480.1 MAG TPA: hypothetical protein [Caudoviricetes sp.]
MAGTEITVLLWQGFLPFPLSFPCGGGYKNRVATAQQRPCIYKSVTESAARRGEDGI